MSVREGAPVLALLPSPLLGPAVWEPVAARLGERGWRTVVPAASVAGPLTPDDALQSFVTALPRGERVALVPHSNAGLYVPALTTMARVAAYVFVDAGLPGPAGRTPLAPPEFYDLLAGKADANGLLPPWTDWWDAADVGALFPSPAVRAEVERDLLRLPLAYFAGSLPVPVGWDRRPGAYLAFGDTYASDREAAAERGWPVATLPARHLHTVVDPWRVGLELEALLGRIGFHPDG